MNSFTLSEKCLRFNIILKLLTCWEINQVTSEYQMEFLDNTCRKGLKQTKKNITIEFYIFKLVWVANVSFNKQF